MGSRGPIPKRVTERGERPHKSNAEVDVTVGVGAREVPVPEADPDWHPIARRIWDAAKASGQVRFYEPSDWAVLYHTCDDITYYKNGNKRSGQMLATINTMLTSLLLTEGDRRRVQIELSRPTSDELKSAGVQEMDKWRKKLTSRS